MYFLLTIADLKEIFPPFRIKVRAHIVRKAVDANEALLPTWARLDRVPDNILATTVRHAGEHLAGNPP